MSNSDDDVPTLAQINAVGRRKALRRLMYLVPAMVTMLGVWIVATPFVGWIVGGGIGGVAGAGLYIGLEKVFGAAPE